MSPSKGGDGGGGGKGAEVSPGVAGLRSLDRPSSGLGAEFPGVRRGRGRGASSCGGGRKDSEKGTAEKLYEFPYLYNKNLYFSDLW